MIENGRPRYWIGWYDQWHVVLPMALVATIGWLAMQPRPIQSSLDTAPVPTRVVPLGTVTIESPVSGVQVRPDQATDIEGRADSGTTVVLFYAPGQSLEKKELTRVRVGAEARYRFRISRFPPGWYVLQAVAYAEDGRAAASAPIDLNVVDGRPPTRRPRR